MLTFLRGDIYLCWIFDPKTTFLFSFLGDLFCRPLKEGELEEEAERLEDTDLGSCVVD